MKSQLQKPVDLDSLPKWRQRVEIAKDVIAAIEIGKFSPESHVYAQIDLKQGSCDALNLEDQAELRDLLGSVENCQVCALGACFVADVSRRNKYKVLTSSIWPGDYNDRIRKYVDRLYVDNDSAMRKRLTDLFGTKQLLLIESAFETSWVTFDTSLLGGKPKNFLSKRAFERAIRFGDKFQCDVTRLIEIMKNIIKHKGRFVP